ncbi:MAG TPA: HAD family phosphatase [Solirubrobacteraceae bacterium]|jgi:putative hydrolase of the HAD superfamily|nr:HAD family phosphatase [Solirubrobacteraceae bacterium]
MGDRHGLIVDYGGVLTSDVFASFRAFCAAEGLPPDTVRDRFRSDPEARDLLAALETGELDAAEFEPRLAAVLEVESERLIARLFGGMAPDEAMVGGVRALRAAGTPTALLSNSWGDALAYDPALLEELFDAWVISSEVGLRKPDPAVYELAAERLGVAPRACVFVDDLPGNLKPARALGMATVLHRGDAAATLAELDRLLR